MEASLFLPTAVYLPRPFALCQPAQAMVAMHMATCLSLPVPSDVGLSQPMLRPCIVRLGAHWQLKSCGDKKVAVNVRALGNFSSFITE
jgi:hypothetical protein